MLKIELIDYLEYGDRSWYAFGIHGGIHSHGELRHGHIWIDLGRWCVEVTIGGRRYWEFMREWEEDQKGGQG